MTQSFSFCYRRLYATPNGHSHFGEAQTPLALVNYAPPALPFLLSAFQPATQWGVFDFPVGCYGARHPSPIRQLAIVLVGAVDVATSTGGRERFQADLLLMEDTSGAGHETCSVGDSELVAVFIQVP